MARLEDLVSQIGDQALRRQIESALAGLKRRQRFGLVFEEHIPEVTALDGQSVQVGSLVVRRDDKARAIYRVTAVVGDGDPPLRYAAVESVRQPALGDERRDGALHARSKPGARHVAREACSIHRAAVGASNGVKPVLFDDGHYWRHLHDLMTDRIRIISLEPHATAATDVHLVIRDGCALFDRVELARMKLVAALSAALSSLRSSRFAPGRGKRID